VTAAVEEVAATGGEAPVAQRRQRARDVAPVALHRVGERGRRDRLALQQREVRLALVGPDGEDTAEHVREPGLLADHQLAEALRVGVGRHGPVQGRHPQKRSVTRR